MSEAEINKIADARVIGMISALSSQCDNFGEFQEIYGQYAALFEEAYKTVAAQDPTLAEYVPLQELSPKDLEQAYNYSRQENQIVNHATAMLQNSSGSVTVSKDEAKRWDINDIGKQLAEGPNLTVLDGGPGAGKSFSLGKSMDAMQVPVICLGSTKSAAAGLLEDMEKENNKLKDGLKETDPAKAEKQGVFGGLTVSQLIPENKVLDDPELQAKKEDVYKALRGTPKPCVMIDEAGLLGHGEMNDVLKMMEEFKVKVILAGDSQQIPENQGQPFKMIAESLKGTKAYVNAPYVFRQGNFMEKAITSGIYHGNNNPSTTKISKEMATEFMIAAYDVGDPKIKYTDSEGNEAKITFKQYMKEKYPKIYEDKSLSDKEKKEKAVKLYVDEMAKTAKKLDPKDLKKAATQTPTVIMGENGKPDMAASFDTYICSALVCQSMGMRAYDAGVRDQIKEVKGNIYENVAEDFASGYADSLKNGLKKREDDAREKAEKGVKEKAANDAREKAEKEAKARGITDEAELKAIGDKAAKEAKADPKALKEAGDKAANEETARGLVYSDGKLAITATEDEAHKMNAKIREQMEKNNSFPPKEPIIENGKRILVDHQTIVDRLNRGENIEFAYALDVKTTQGMSQVGKVTLVVRGDTLNQIHGGEILVGASRHKGEFETKLDEGAAAKKDQFFKTAEQQYASARVIGEVVNPKLYEAAPKDQPEKPNKTHKKIASRTDDFSERRAKFNKERSSMMSQLMGMDVSKYDAAAKSAERASSQIRAFYAQRMAVTQAAIKSKNNGNGK